MVLFCQINLFPAPGCSVTHVKQDIWFSGDECAVNICLIISDCTLSVSYIYEFGYFESKLWTFKQTNVKSGPIIRLRA